MVTVIFPAAGVGRRMGAGKNKALLDLCGKPVLVRTLLRFSECDKVDDFIVAVGAEEVGEVSRMLEKTQGLKPFRVVAGGAERQYSVQNALAALSPDTEIVLVHDAARPLVTVKTIEAVVAEAWRSGAGIAAVRAKNTIKIVRGDGVVESTPDRARLADAAGISARCFGGSVSPRGAGGLSRHRRRGARRAAGIDRAGCRGRRPKHQADDAGRSLDCRNVPRT